MKLLHRLAAAGLAFFALASLFRTAPAYLGLAASVPGAVLASWPQGRQSRLPFDAIQLLALALLIWLSLRASLQLWGGVGQPALTDVASGFRNWLYLLAFAPLAALPCADPLARVRLLWLLAMLGFALGVASFLVEHGVALLWSGERLGFHLERPLGAGLYAGCFAIMLLFTVRQWWHCKGRLRWPARIGGVMLIALFIQVVIGAQNRSNFLGALVVLAFAIALALAQLRRRPGRPARPGHIGAAVLLACGLLAVVLPNIDTIGQRSSDEHSALSAVLSDGLEDAPVASVTVRLRLWQFALEQIPQAPLLGHGFGDLVQVIDAELRPRGGLNAHERYDHLHNTYLQLLWSQGAIGFALWAALVCLLAVRAAHAARALPERQALMPAMWATLIFVAVWALFDYRQSHPDMRFFSILALLSMRLLALPPSAGAKGAA